MYCCCWFVAQSCLTLCDPMDCSPRGSSVHGISQARILEWVVIFFLQGFFLTQGSNSHLPHCNQILHCWATREAHMYVYVCACFCCCGSLSHVQLFATISTAVRQASLSFTISWSLLKLMSIESTMPSKHLILYRPLLLLPSIFPSIRVFSNESALHIKWPKFWSFSFSIIPSNEYSGLTSFRID